MEKNIWRTAGLLAAAMLLWGCVQSGGNPETDTEEQLPDTQPEERETVQQITDIPETEVQPDEQTTETEGPEEPTLPAELTEQAAVLTDQLVMRVMSSDWLTPGYVPDNWDLHWFLVTMDLYMDEPLYPWSGEMTLVQDASNQYRCFSGDTARRAVRELFGCDLTNPDSGYSLPVSEDIYDSETDTYRMILGAGRNTTAFWYENMDVSAEGNMVWADVDLVSARWFEWEEMYYGRYRFTYCAVTEDGQTFLRLAGIEMLYSGYREDTAVHA